MRKRNVQSFNLRQVGVYLGLTAFFAFMATNILSGEKESHNWKIKNVKSLEWTVGTAASDTEFITLDVEVASLPSNYAVGQEVCFNVTATNQLADTGGASATGDTLKNVMIADGDGIVIASAVTLLPNGVTIGTDINPLTGSGTFMLTTMTGSLCNALTQEDINNGFVVESYTVTATTCSMPPQTVSACADAITCFGVSLTCSDINISLDQECETLLTPELLAINTKIPANLVRIRIQESDGSYRAIPMVTGDDVGTPIKIVVDVPGCSNVAPCWSYGFIEYKLGPAQICSVDTVTCAQNIAMSTPTLTTACGETTLIRGNVVRQDLCRTSDLFIAKETVTYAVQDQFGNVSDTCTQVRYILKPNITEDDISYPSDTTLSCDADIFMADGAVDPLVVGVPTWDGVPIWRNDGIVQNCNVFAEYEDIQDLDVFCERTIIRRWDVREWKCEGGSTELDPVFQRIVLSDDTAPVISGIAPVLTLSTNGHTCSAFVDIPRPTVTDNCQPDETIELEIRYPGGSSLLNESLTSIEIPLGEGNKVYYIARDRCMNVRIDSSIINVVDNTPPVSICLEKTTVTISDTAVTVGIDKFDQDSFDDCGIVKTTVRKMFEVSGPDDTVEGQSVTFCCAEGGTDVPVIIRSYDSAGNFNECMVMVTVFDKSVATVVCLPDITVSCDFEFDPEFDLERFFGTIQATSEEILPINVPDSFFVSATGDLLNGFVEDNCAATVRELDPVVQRDDICRTGRIVRFFEITDASNVVTRCRQEISIVGDQQNNPLMFEYFPEPVEIVVESPEDFENLAQEDPPRIMNTGCSLIGLGYTDEAFETNTGDHCTKILRTWKVIDWCRNPTGKVELDSTQIILVIDTEAPEVTVSSGVTFPVPKDGQFVTLVASAEDNVVSNPRQLDWSYQLFRLSPRRLIQRGDITALDFVNESPVLRFQEGITEGNYEMRWFVGDKCGNIDTTLQTFRVREGEEEVASVLGDVHDLNGDEMDLVEVFLSTRPEAYENAEMAITDVAGTYAFNNMPMGGSYYVDPEKNDDHLNGVSTLDLLLIQRHILGISKLTEPGHLIAADVNADTRITAADLVEIRKLILGYSAAFENQDSWVFVSNEQDLATATATKSPLMESYFIPELANEMNVPFIGIKTGDVSGDAVGHSAGFGKGRSYNATTWSYQVTPTKNTYEVAVVATEAMTISGVQADFTWATELEALSFKAGALPINAQEMNWSTTKEGHLPVAHISDKNIEVVAGDVLFAISFAKTDIASDVVFDVLEESLAAQVYTDEEVYELNIEQAIESIEVLTMRQNTPNPWSESTTIEVQVPVAGQSNFRIYDVQNRLIHSEVRAVNRGTNYFTVTNSEIKENGFYFYEVEVEGLIARDKMIRVN